MSSRRTWTSRGHGERLDVLVARTRGPRPWRRVFHAASGVSIATAVAQLPLSRVEMVTILAGVLAVPVALDVARLTNESANRLFFRVLTSLASPREAHHVASSTWYLIGVLIAVAVFPRPDAVSGVLVLGLADPAASWIGRRWGRRPFLGGTLLGSATFAAVTFGVVVLGHPLPLAAAAALATTLAERRSWPLDDNLTIPVVCAAVLTGLGRMV